MVLKPRFPGPRLAAHLAFAQAVSQVEYVLNPIWAISSKAPVTPMLIYPEVLDVKMLVWVFIYVQTLYMGAAKALAHLRILHLLLCRLQWTLFDNVISTVPK